LKKYKYFIVAGLFFLTIYAVVPSVNYTNCLSNQKFREVTIDGVVVDKYFDKSQHSTPIVEIENFEGLIDSIYFWGDHSGLFNKIQIKDTLKKKNGSNEILIKVEGKFEVFGIANFKCDSAKLEKEKFLSWLYDLVGTIPQDNTIKKQ
jgi:hypothetical protein